MDNGSLLGSFLILPLALVLIPLGLIAVFTSAIALNFVIGRLVAGGIKLVTSRGNTAEEPAPADAETGSF